MKFKITVYPLQRGIRQAGDAALDAAAALREGASAVERRAGEAIWVDTAARGDELLARGEGEDGVERFEFALNLADL